MSLTFESEKQKRMSFLDVHIIREDKTFPTSFYSKPTFVDFRHILTAFYDLPISFVLFTHSLIDTSEYA